MVDVQFSQTDALHSSECNSYEKVTIHLSLSRKLSVWFVNVILPLFGVTSLCFCGFLLEPSQNNDRMAIYAALLLSIVAIKFTIADKLPDRPYVTWCVHSQSDVKLTNLFAIQARCLYALLHDSSGTGNDFCWAL